MQSGLDGVYLLRSVGCWSCFNFLVLVSHFSLHNLRVGLEVGEARHGILRIILKELVVIKAPFFLVTTVCPEEFSESGFADWWHRPW